MTTLNKNSRFIGSKKIPNKFYIVFLVTPQHGIILPQRQQSHKQW